MSNERLRAALRQAGLEIDDLAAQIQVDPKTAQRWLAGRTPHPRHRARVAAALSLTQPELWPELTTGPATRDRTADDLIGAYARASDPIAPDWRALLDSSTDQIDLLDPTLADVITGPEVISQLARKAAGGAQIRILLSDPDSAHLAIADTETTPDASITHRTASSTDAARTLGYLQPVLALPNLQTRTFIQAHPNTILRFDEQMLVALHLRAVSARHAPLLHLQRNTDDGLFGQFHLHYDRIWRTASNPVAGDPTAYPDPDQHPERYPPPPI